MEETELIEIIKKAKSGDKYAFELLCKRYHGYIKNLSYKYYIKSETQDEVYQAGLIGLWRGIKYFDKHKNTNANIHILTCIKRNIITEIRLANRKKHSFLNDFYSIDAEAHDNDTDIKFIDKCLICKISTEDEVIQCFEEKKIKDCISNETGKMRGIKQKCIQLYLEGFKQREICKILNLKPKQVDDAINGAKMSIKKKYNSIEEFKIANSF